MATAVEVKDKTEVNVSSNLSFYCYTTLNDKEQIIIEIEETEYKMIQNNYTRVSTGVIKKVRLEKIVYQRSRGDNHEVGLYSIEVRGFRKDKGLRYRTDTLYNPTQQVIDQIPDEYHNYAREAFVTEMKQLQEELTFITNEGVKIGTN
jgi:hypothetical protein